jgi:RimJ/RimL family protein N-acetyltransferase
MVPPLHTARLVLSPAVADDLDALHALWADADVRHYLFDDEPVSRERAAAVLADTLALADGLGLWSVRLKGGRDLIGCVGLMPVATAAEYDPSLAGAVEPLAAFAPAAWGNGYATEALTAVLRYGFDDLGLPLVAAVNDVPNAASDRLVRRLGFEVTGECDGPKYRLRTCRLTPPAFAAAVAGASA